MGLLSERDASPLPPAREQFPETDLDKGIVGWEGQDDPANPQNFSPAQKWSLLGLISSVTIISPLASSMFAPAVSYMATEFKVTNTTLLSFSVSIYLLGYTVSVLLDISPLAGEGLLMQDPRIISSVRC